MTDIMLDIETLGLKPGSIVVSVGACVFDRHTGEIGEKLYAPISVNSCEKAGLIMEPQTVIWWMGQEKEARDAWMIGARSLRQIAQEFYEWFRIAEEGEEIPLDGSRAGRAAIWAQGDMDFNVWGAAMESVAVAQPWAFWAQRDTRTVYDICGFDAKSVDRDGTYHNALDDARHQVKCLHAAMKSKGLAQ